MSSEQDSPIRPPVPEQAGARAGELPSGHPSSDGEQEARPAQTRIAELIEERAFYRRCVEALEHQLEEKARLREELDEIYRSRGWALLQAARAARRLVLPKGSRRERVVRFCWRALRRTRLLFPQRWRFFLKGAIRRALGTQPRAETVAAKIARRTAGGGANTVEWPGLVSIVLPVYNHAALLRGSIESVLAQTYANIELIIINDGSGDAVSEVLAEYAARPRVHVLTQPNQKLPRALSNGFEFARGEFWTWTSADNLMEPAQIERLVDFLRRHADVALVYADYLAIDDAGRPLQDRRFRPHNRRDPNSPAIYLPHDPSSLNGTKDNFIGPCFLYRAWAGRLLGEYAPEFGLEDYDYWMRMNGLFRVAHLDSDELLYRYRVHDDTISAAADELRIGQQVARLMEYERERSAFYNRAWTIYADEPTRRRLKGVNCRPHTIREIEKLGAAALAGEDDREEGGQDAHSPEKRLMLVAAENLAGLRAGGGAGGTCGGPLEDTCVAAWFAEDPRAPYTHRAAIGKADVCFCPDADTAARVGLFHPRAVGTSQGQSLFDLAIAFANNHVFYRRTVDPQARRRVLPVPFRPPGRPNVLLQAGHFMQGGMEQVVLDLLAMLPQEGFEPALLLLGETGPAAAKARELGVEVLELPRQDREACYFRLLRERQFKLINTHYCAFGARTAADLGIPYVQTIHSCYVSVPAQAAAEYRQSDAYTAGYICTSSTTACYADLKLELSPRKMVIIPNGLDLDRLKLPDRAAARARLREELGLAPDDFVFLHVGTIYCDKGQSLIAAALANVLKTCPRAKVVLAGGVLDEGYLKRVRQDVQRLGLEKAVIFAGYRDQIAPIYAMADAFLLPSFWEGWSLALAEAVYMGLPVIATAAGSATDLLGEVGGHLLRPVYDSIVDVDVHTLERYLSCDHSRLIGDLAEAMKAVYADPRPPAVSDELRARMDRRVTYGLHARLFAWLLAGGDAAAARCWMRGR